ncbi:Ger(x)C family spore germination protein [Ammoniphilus resinae]|uniref:Ger(X)C family germination protein n=1 Tax=Ammoniphilus resinae TaxID=861532 RepID=A0ABS4GUI3_9BACL|nr:Ger(x)C family spore germination protein [Ammoniphilus resinae]MBP1933911.1 Ger(x)C family germination protein [Ammoniphilus resinae]
MPKIKITCNLLLFLAIVFLLSGCWDRSELENKAYVIGLGIDRSKYEGKIKVTMLIANPEVGSMQGGGGSSEKPREIITLEAIDIITAKSTANAVISREISYELLKVIIVSEEFAKDKEFLPTLFTSIQDKEIRLDTFLVVCKEKAYEYFQKNRPRMETRPHKYFQYMIDHGIQNGYIADSTLFRFIKTIERGTDLALAMYTTAEKEKNPPNRGEDEYIAGQLNVFGELDDTQFIGSAVFRNGVMTDILTGQETRIVNILDDTVNIGDILINLPDPFSDKRQQIAVRILKTENNTFKMNLKGAKPKITITIPLKFEIMSNPSMVNFADSEENRQILKKHIAEDTKISFEKFLRKTQTELKGSPLPLSRYALKYFATNQEFEHFNWEKSYLEAEIIIKPDIQIIDYGKQLRPKK